MKDYQLVEVNQPKDYVPSVSITPDQAIVNFEKLDEIKKRVMKEKVDYDLIPGTQKPSLLKPGAEHLLQFFGLTHDAQITNRVMDWDKGFFYFEATCRVYKNYPDGTNIQLSSCTGSANSKEKRYRNQDVFTIVNTLQKMAIKRALVGATLQATGTSSFFTQDVEDFDPQPRQSDNNQQRYQQKHQPAKQHPPLRKDLQEMYSYVRENDLKDQVMILLPNYSVEKSTDLTPEQVQDLMQKLKGYVHTLDEVQAQDELKTAQELFSE